MDNNELISTLKSLADNYRDDLYERVISATSSNPEIQNHFKEVSRRLQLAINRELMDELQTKLAFRVSVRNFVKDWIEKEEKKKELVKK